MKSSFIAVLACVLLFLAAPARAESITLVADVWCPYNCQPGSERPGYMIEIAKEAFAKHGIEVVYFNVPWTRAIEDARVGKYNAIIGGFKSDAPDFIYPAHPLGRSGSTFYIKKGNPWRYQGMSSLAQISLGVIADYSYGEDIDKYFEQNKDNPALVQIVSGDNAMEINIKKLIAGRVGTFIEDTFVMQYFLQQNKDIARQVAVGGEYEIIDYTHIAFSPVNAHSKKYAGILSSEIENMRASGRVKAIMQQYGLEEFVLPVEEAAQPVPPPTEPKIP